jgi:anti-sigma factor RsiW
MTCAETRQQLGAYVLGGLEPEEAAEVRAHLDRCGDCAREEADLAGLPAMLDLIDAGSSAPRGSASRSASRRRAGCSPRRA